MQATCVGAAPFAPPAENPEPTRSQSVRAATLSRLLALGGICALFLAILVRCAWITEDAYIMFRSIDNFIHGYGLTWNITERVQVYTCPLWFFTLVPFHALTGEYYLTAIAVCALVSLTTVALVAWRVAPTTAAGVLGGGILLASKGFVDYSTSGLENPLTHLMLVAFALAWFRVAANPTPRGLLLATFLASLGMVNRLDTALLFAPALAALAWRVPKRAGLGAGLAGLTPLVAWEAFSLIYYGFLFPNTAYAKLNLGIPATDLMRQGLCYYANAAITDPMALVAIATGVGAALAGRRWPESMLALGVLLYLAYIVKIGGDYMSMRFFTAPLVVAVVLLVRAPWLQSRRAALIALGCFVALSAALPRSPLRRGWKFGPMDPWGVSDERGHYYEPLGLMSAVSQWRRGEAIFPHVLEQERDALRHERGVILSHAMVGFPIFRRAAADYVVDNCALTSPLLARLPMCDGPWRVGHYFRHFPDGYLATLRDGVNRFRDPNLAAYYDKLHLVVAGDLWTAERWRAIWEFQTGQLDGLIDHAHYRRTGKPPPR